MAKEDERVDEAADEPGAVPKDRGIRGARPRRQRLSGAKRAEFLFNASSFVLVVVSVFFVFGGFYVAKRFGGGAMVSQDLNQLVNNALLLGVLSLELALIMKLYSLLIRFRGLPQLIRMKEGRSEWFLKVASATFTTAAAVNVATAIWRSREFASYGRMIGGGGARMVNEAANALVHQSWGIASFFLLLSIFTLVYLLNLKYTQFSMATTLVETGGEAPEAAESAGTGD